MNEIDVILQKLQDYYKVNTLSALAKELNISQPALTKWKQKNSIATAKKKCKELKIYDKIFVDYEEIELQIAIQKKLEIDTLLDIASFFNKLNSFKPNGILKNKEGVYIVLYNTIQEFNLEEISNAQNKLYNVFIKKIQNYSIIKSLKNGILEKKDTLDFLERSCSINEIQSVITFRHITLPILYNELNLFNKIKL